jgi:hypothetical protein
MLRRRPRGAAIGDLPPRGAARTANRTPEIAIVELARDAEAITLGYDLHDPDGDLVAGQLRAGEPLIGTLHSGRGRVVIARAGASNPAALIAVVDDGAGFVEVPAGELDAGAP